MHNELEKAIEVAIHDHGNTKAANKAYLEFIKANFVIPIEQSSSTEEPVVLFLENDKSIFLPVFSRKEYLHAWASDIQDHIQILNLSGVNLLKGIGDDVTVSLNIGTPYYKEFNSAELARMRSMIMKIMG